MINGSTPDNWSLGPGTEAITGLIRAIIGNGHRPGQTPSAFLWMYGADWRELAILTAIVALLVKLAQGDGVFADAERRFCAEAIDRMNLSGGKRRYCEEVLDRVPRTTRSIYDYAAAFVRVQNDMSVREIVYDALWDLAWADGVLEGAEDEILRQLVTPLRVRPSLYAWHKAHHGPLAAETGFAGDPYEVIGAAPSADDETLHEAYRAKAKRLHPDALRAQGVCEELVARAQDQMARLNAAWAEIRRQRALA